MNIASFLPAGAPQLSDFATFAETSAFKIALAGFFADRPGELASLRWDVQANGSRQQLEEVDALIATVRRRRDRLTAA